MAFTKEEKTKMIDQYESWINSSQAVFLLQYSKMTMKEIDTARTRAREAGGELHVVKNTLFSIALDRLGFDGQQFMEESTLVGFAFNDAPAMAKVVTDVVKSDAFKVKGGMMGKRAISASDVKALADMPPLPVVRAQLLGVLNAPASKLVRTIAEPARGLAAVVKAFSEKDAAAAPAEAVE